MAADMLFTVSGGVAASSAAKKVKTGAPSGSPRTGLHPISSAFLHVIQCSRAVSVLREGQMDYSLNAKGGWMYRERIGDEGGGVDESGVSFRKA
jgi:hypothetical protein